MAGIDKAVVMHFRHGVLRDYYPEIRNGWYLPTRGNFRFGGRVHYSVGHWTVFLMTGKELDQDFRDNSTVLWGDFSAEKVGEGWFLTPSLHKRNNNNIVVNVAFGY